MTTLKSITMVIKRFEITVVDPVTDNEWVWFYDNVSRIGLEASLSQSQRVILIEGCENIYELVEILADFEFIHDIGLIKEVIDYEPNFEDELLIAIDLDDSSM